MWTVRAMLSFLLFAACAVGDPVLHPAIAQESSSHWAIAIPETPAGRQLSGWLKAFNSGDPDKLRSFHSSSGPTDRVDRRTQQDSGFYRQTRGLELRKIEPTSNHELAALVQAKLTEGWYRVSIIVDAEPPNPIATLSVRGASNPSPVKLSEAEAIKSLEAYLKKLTAADVFSGTILVAKNGKPIFTSVYGMANTAYRIPNRLDTKFNLGSMNKMFTAVAVCQLAEQGKLAFTDPIGKHLTDYPNKPASEKVTIHHLLTHTSGIGDYFNDKFMEASRDRFRESRTTFHCSLKSLWSLSRAPGSGTATQGSWCWGQSLNGRRARTTSTTSESTSTNPQEWSIPTHMSWIATPPTWLTGIH